MHGILQCAPILTVQEYSSPSDSQLVDFIKVGSCIIINATLLWNIIGVSVLSPRYRPGA